MWGLFCQETSTDSSKKKGPCGVCFVEIQPLRVAKNGLGHDRVLNGIYEGNRSGWVMGGGVSIYMYMYVGY